MAEVALMKVWLVFCVFFRTFTNVLSKQRVLSTMRILSTKRTLDLENIGLHVQKKTRTLINNQTTPTKPTAAEKRLPKPPARDLLSELHATLQ